MKRIPFCPHVWCGCASIPDWGRRDHRVAVHIANARARRTGRRQQVLKRDLGAGPTWLIQEIR